jgi:hyperosmotically inducible periplasmic protein
MRPRMLSIGLLAVALTTSLACSDRRAPDVTGDVRHALERAGLNDVRVSQDRDKGVVTLSGNVKSDEDKMRAESVAKSVAGNEVVANEIGVRPAGDESTARKVASDLDSGIDKNLSATLEEHKLKNDVHYDVNNAVVTLKGNVRSQSQRDSVQRLAEQVPNVKQVVNELEVKDQKATSSR